MIDLFNWQQMARCYLDFPFEDQPKWRDHKQPTTNEMVKDIVEFRKKYEQLPEHAKQFCTGDFSSIMAVEFICHLDVGRAVGSQTKRGTKDVMKLIYDNASKKPDRDDKEGLGTFNAWDAMNNLTTLNGGFLTVENILMVHKILMEGLVEKLEENGKLRETCTYVNWEGSLYIYPCHQDVEDKLHAVVDSISSKCPRLKTTLKRKWSMCSNVPPACYLILSTPTHLAMVMAVCVVYWLILLSI